MSKGYPSMTALLGLLAVAGYQNRDKIAELLKSGSAGAAHGTVPHVPQGSGSSNLGNLGSLLGGVGTAGVGGLIASGLSELVDHFTKGGHGETANSWINQGQNRDIPEADLEKAIGAETLDGLQKQTGLSRADILSRLSRDLPSAIDRYAQDGRQPA
ncbi:hypothetical protein ASF27_13295 [Methylobacterium sp. Leaf102]|jgi:uncharacterized protein YidB (DUF937 family)|uniref:YidB family protein n=1 Tax=unclassified Methylobacterium TaxID=2615210 RepID=UPI0006F9DBFE|nr:MULTISPECIES: YidB family protein [unclassified Methylobacterium]KQO56196.1 hypothetical protein ASF22_09970 [Methylobacterium sp. Leaf87]KQP23756.1 hypothetical protein ASF27_13295 [Methylobacterium sp. Leaf102]KQP32003.1 hypothetical protein ASF25_03495 [Methylobacterium sp. Leaf100]